MAMHPRLIVDDILAELRTQLDAHGEVVGPKIARLKWPNVSSSSWSRYVQKARQEWTESMRLSQAGLPVSSIPVTTAAPAAAAPDASSDIRADGSISWTAQITALLKQCDLIARQSIIVDPQTGVERVRNPLTLQQSIRARAAVLKLAADREAVQYGAERVAHWESQMVREIFRAIGKVRTEDQKVISLRVRRALEGIAKRRAEEREFLSGSMTPKAEPTETPSDKPE